MGGVGLTPLEAILCNTPVIVTDGCGELIKEANAGYIVNYGDIIDLKERMKFVLENPKEGGKLVNKGKKYIKENLVWDNVLKHVEEIYENCIHHD
jgi:glycosyltransferase involved in cell wall biosynthesis